MATRINKSLAVVIALAVGLMTATSFGQTKDELLALLKDPNSDWSTLFAQIVSSDAPTDYSALKVYSNKMDELQTLAQLDAQSFVKTYSGEIRYSHFIDIGRKHALGHGLLGFASDFYSASFADTMTSLTAKD